MIAPGPSAVPYEKTVSYGHGRTWKRAFSGGRSGTSVSRKRVDGALKTVFP